MKKFLKKVLPWFAMVEGLDHFIISTIAVIGLVHARDYRFFAWFTPIVDYIFGVGTFTVGYVFKGGKKDGG